MQVSGHSPGPCARPHCLQAWPLHVRQVVLILGGPQVAASLVPRFLASRHSQSADRRGTGPGATSAWRTLGLRPGGPRPPPGCALGVTTAPGPGACTHLPQMWAWGGAANVLT